MWASRAKGRCVPGRVEIAPFGQVPRGFAQFVERLAAIALGAPGEPRQGAGQGGGGRGQAALDPAAKDAGEDAQGVGLREFLEDRIDARLHGAAAQQLRAEGVDGADEGAVQAARRFGQAPADVGIEFAGAAAFQLVADAQFHVAGGGVGEGDRHDGFHRRPGGDDFHDAVHQRRGLARAGGGLHHPTAVEIGEGSGGHAGNPSELRSDGRAACARWQAADVRAAISDDCPHRQPRSSFKSFNSACDFSLTRSSS